MVLLDLILLSVVLSEFKLLEVIVFFMLLLKLLVEIFINFL